MGTTRAAVWHIRVCGLNADHLVYERRRRAEHWTQIKRTAVLVKGNHEEVVELIRRFREEVELMIPEIAAAPSDFSFPRPALPPSARGPVVP